MEPYNIESLSYVVFLIYRRKALVSFPGSTKFAPALNVVVHANACYASESLGHLPVSFSRHFYQDVIVPVLQQVYDDYNSLLDPEDNFISNGIQQKLLEQMRVKNYYPQET